MTPKTVPNGPGSLRGDDSEYRDYRRVGIRLTEPLDQLVGGAGQAQASGFSRGLQQFDKAHTVMLTEEGIIPKKEAQICLEALLEIDANGVTETRSALPGGMHAGEGYLIRKLGMEVGGIIHAGRSSWDLIRVAHRIAFRDTIMDVMDALHIYQDALLKKASAHVETVMPYYTHGQQGQPTTFAHHVHGFVCAAERDFERLHNAYRHMNISPAGAAAGTASRFPTNRQRVADLLGFDKTSTNTRDSSSNYDHMWEMASSLSFVAASLGFLADEIVLWMGNEFGLVQLADRYCGTSSIMTHKRNPTAAEQVQGLRTSLTGRVPTSYTPVDLLEAGRRVSNALRLCAGMVETLKVNQQAMLDTTIDSWAQASDLAAFLVETRHLPIRMAHQIVGILVRLCEEEGIRPKDVQTQTLDRASILFLGEPLGLSQEDLSYAMNPEVAVATRRSVGSPSSQEMHDQISTSQEILDANQKRLSNLREHSDRADQSLEEAIKTL